MTDDKRIEVPEPAKPILPIEDGVAGRDQEEKARKDAELDAEREEHKRRSEGGDPQ